MKKKSILETPHLKELKKKKQKKNRNKILIIVAAFLIFLTGLVFLSHWKEIRIQDIQVEGNKIVETKDIKIIAESYMQGKYLGLFPKNNSFVYPEKKIKNELANKYRRLKNVDVEVDANDLKTLWITVSEYSGEYMWCGEQIISDNIDQQCYFLDSNGYIFDKAPYFSGDVYFKFYGKESEDFDVLNPIGFYFLPEYFNKIVSFKESVTQMNLKPVIFNLADKEAGEGSFYLASANQAPNAPEILFKLNSDYEKLEENLQSAITTDPLQTNLKGGLSNLNYLDLRFGNKIYYKFKNNQNGETEPLAEN